MFYISGLRSCLWNLTRYGREGLDVWVTDEFRKVVSGTKWIWMTLSHIIWVIDIFGKICWMEKKHGLNGVLAEFTSKQKYQVKQSLFKPTRPIVCVVFWGDKLTVICWCLVNQQKHFQHYHNKFFISCWSTTNSECENWWLLFLIVATNFFTNFFYFILLVHTNVIGEFTLLMQLSISL